MSRLDPPARRRLLLQGVAGVALIILGATAYLWIAFDDRLPTTTASAGPGSLPVWAVVRLAAAAALAGGTWLLAVSQVGYRRHRSR